MVNNNKGNIIAIIAIIITLLIAIFQYVFKPLNIELIKPRAPINTPIPQETKTLSQGAIQATTTPIPQKMETPTQDTTQIPSNGVHLPEHNRPEEKEKINLNIITFTDSGSHAGRDANWKYGDGVIYIDGSGEMYNWNSSRPPWYDYCNQITSVVIGSGITTIGSNTFRDCLALEQVEIPPSINKIGSYAFMDCRSLESFIVPSTVKFIGAHAFNGCISLKDIFVSEGVNEIDAFAFKTCTALSRIVFPKSVVKLGNNVFDGCTNLKELHIISKIISAAAYPFNNTSPELIMYCYKDSTAEADAKLYKIQYRYYIE